MRNGVLYRGSWLMRGSKARQLLDDRDFKALDRHLKELDEAEKKRVGFFEESSTYKKG